jgi:glucose-6-phosphate-specific signal transduction histidine kinase
VILGIGYGPWQAALLMLLATAGLTYGISRGVGWMIRRMRRPEITREYVRQRLYEERRRARELAARFDRTDEEIEREVERVMRVQERRAKGPKN